MMKKTHFHIIICLLLCVVVSGCTEQYALQTNTFESALVVEATVTNELKQQQIKITRTYRLEEQRPTVESGAEVTVTDSEGNQYFFEESAGVYLSTAPFQAVAGRTYRLNIVTSDGRTYNSTPEQMSPVNNMESLVPTVQVKNNERGVGLVVNSFDPTGSSKYYRYEYEETYKIIAPFWDDEKTILAPFEPGDLHQGILIVPRTEETQTCYHTNISDEIIQTTTTGLGEDRVNFAVRFISVKDYIITHRYSILVRQYVQNLASYTYYKTLKNLSGSGSLLSQNQPGFFYGNIKSADNPNEKVIGFFDVSTVSSERIFFNFIDIFPNDPLPKYVSDCKVKDFKDCFNNFDPECKGAALRSIIGSNSLVYVDSDGSQSHYFMVDPPCGDCTRIGSNIRPSFWTD